MKRSFYLLSVIAFALTLSSCNPNYLKPENSDPVEEIGPFFGIAEFSVPAGVQAVYVEYKDKGGNTSTIEVPVTPEVEAPTQGRDREPFGFVKMRLVSDVKTSVSIYSVPEILTKAGEEQRVYYLEAFHVNRASGGTLDMLSGVTDVHVEEPAPYVSDAEGQTFYHSSGVVMFDDSWPGPPSETGNFISDYNDVVVDYDFEARIVDDSLLEKEGWKEQLKVVMHLRAVGGDRPARFGLILENFDQQYISDIELHTSLDSYQNPHGELPSSFWQRIGRNCVHDETNPLRPWFEVGGIHRLNENVDIANEEYTYTNYDEEGNLVSSKHVFNPSFGYWSAPDESQYAPGIQRKMQHYYNATPGYVNVGGGLITFTLIYHMKPRAEMTAEQSAAAKQNMIDIVMQTTRQNFYIMLMNYSEICLKGYQPRDSYQAKYNEAVAGSTYLSGGSTYYAGSDGQVWGIKAPVLTRHLWEKYPFASAYPKFYSWISGDTSASDWYLDYEDQYLSCWW